MLMFCVLFQRGVEPSFAKASEGKQPGVCRDKKEKYISQRGVEPFDSPDVPSGSLRASSQEFVETRKKNILVNAG